MGRALPRLALRIGNDSCRLHRRSRKNSLATFAHAYELPRRSSSTPAIWGSWRSPSGPSRLRQTLQSANRQ